MLTAVRWFHFTVSHSLLPFPSPFWVITSVMHRFKNSTGQMTLGGLCYPFSKKGKGVVLPSAVLTVQPDTRMVMVQGSSPFSSIFWVTSTVVGNFLLLQEF